MISMPIMDDWNPHVNEYRCIDHDTIEVKLAGGNTTYVDIGIRHLLEEFRPH
jgi:hypothetical protein